MTDTPDVLNPEHDVVQRARWATEPLIRAKESTLRQLVTELADEVERLRVGDRRPEPGTSVLHILYAQRVVDAGMAEFTSGLPTADYQRVRWLPEAGR